VYNTIKRFTPPTSSAASWADRTTVPRTVPMRVMVARDEKQELLRAAKKLDVPASRFIREEALKGARALEKAP
jgi:hypothetical protein